LRLPGLTRTTTVSVTSRRYACFDRVEHCDLTRRNGDMHHDIVANRFELKREERTAYAFPPGQIAGGGLDYASQHEVKSLRLPTLRPHHEGE
jgi:hypothetical protein